MAEKPTSTNGEPSSFDLYAANEAVLGAFQLLDVPTGFGVDIPPRLCRNHLPPSGMVAEGHAHSVESSSRRRVCGRDRRSPDPKLRHDEKLPHNEGRGCRKPELKRPTEIRRNER